jgi:hypothetical protein
MADPEFAVLLRRLLTEHGAGTRRGTAASPRRANPRRANPRRPMVAGRVPGARCAGA